MWRLCDLHAHTVPNEQDPADWDAKAFIQSCVDHGLHVVAVTDHDHMDHVEEAIEAADSSGVDVLAGVEISTDRGHILVMGPGPSGIDEIRMYLARTGVQPGKQSSCDEILRVARTEFPQSLLAIGAHVDSNKSLLATDNSLSLEGQIALALLLDALEVEDDRILEQWLKGGVKQQKDTQFAIIRGSDRHGVDAGPGRRTWLYLPTLEVASFRHASAVPEASIRFDDPVNPSQIWIERIEFNGGFHDGLAIELSERTNALIGAPNVEKTFVVDALKFAFDMKSGTPEVDALTEARMGACLAGGDSVRVLLRTPDGQVEIERIVGAATIPEAPLAPIVFSQTELVRRAHEPHPSIDLLDIHNPTTGQLKTELARLRNDTESRFLSRPSQKR